MKKEEVIEYLAVHRIYPLYSKKGKVFWRDKESLLSDEDKEEFIRILEINNYEDCTKIREEIKSRARKVKKYTPIKHWIKDERPRELLVKNGPENLSLSKLLAIIIRTGSDSKSAEELAKILLNEFGSLRGLDRAEISQLCSIPGIGIAKAVEIKAALEIGKRLYREEVDLGVKIKGPKDAVMYVKDYYAPYLRDLNKEVFNIILLDHRNKVIDNIELSKGSINASIVDPKEIIREVTLKSASSVILVHNHPSGDTSPSRDDIETTNQVVEACKIVGIRVLDHIILGRNNNDYTSFAELGLLK
ncbi:MAG: DNA repair protein RadC [bacterium]|nr:DNA repair protein RadC [bacterium]